MKEKWYCTDKDCLQYCKENSDGTFEFIEKVALNTYDGNTCYIVKKALIDIRDYTAKEIEAYISSYYDSLDQLKKNYGKHSNEIIAECIFEEMNNGKCDVYGAKNEEDADAFIKNFIEK